MSALIKAAHRLAAPYKVTRGKKFSLQQIDPDETRGLESKQQAVAALQHGVEALREMQERLYAQNTWSLLLIFQAMDAAGKDGAIEHVMSGVNPQGCQVFSFKQPSAEELDHDYLWRTSKSLPERGRIGIFNRSYYEEVVVVRVHPEFLKAQRIPPALVNGDIWKQRFEQINNFETHLTQNGTKVLKFFLHLSKEEQRKRFIARLDEPDKNWKFSIGDAKERELWKPYQHAYEEMIRHTATEHAPWFVVPADHKWFTRVVVAAAIASSLHDLKLKYPTVSPAKHKELEAAREALA